MAANESYTCLHEDQIQGQSRKIERLEARADFKDQRLDEINNKMDKMEEKIDDLSDNVNKLILQSTKDDKNLEMRLTKIETDMENQEQEKKALLEQLRGKENITLDGQKINLYANQMHNVVPRGQMDAAFLDKKK